MPQSYEEYEERVLLEREDVGDRRANLRNFLEEPGPVTSIDAKLLRAQAAIMDCYIAILDARIMRFDHGE